MPLEHPAEPSTGQRTSHDRKHGVRLNMEVCAGIFLLTAAALGYYAALPLDAGSMSGVGSGLVPKATSIGLAGFGLYLIALGLWSDGERIQGFSLRGTIFILGAIFAFAATVRPLGLLVAGPLAMLLSSLADPDTRPREILLFTAFMTAGCYLLFKVILSLPIPVLPPLLGY